MLLNTEKTKVMIITTRQKRMHINENILSLSYNDVELQVTTGDKILGVNIDENLIWNNQHQFVCKKVCLTYGFCQESVIFLLLNISCNTKDHIYNHILIIVILSGETHPISM